MGDDLMRPVNLKEPAMQDGNKPWITSNVADAIPLAIEAISFYSPGDTTSASIYVLAEFVFLVIVLGPIGAS